jgi:hypothetical protein
VDKEHSEDVEVQLKRKYLDRVTGLHAVPMICVWQCCHESGDCKTSVQHILQSEKIDGEKRTAECPPRSPDLTPQCFYFWGDLKNVVCNIKTKNVAGTETKIKIASVAIPPATQREVCHCCMSLSTKHLGWW